jgi:hypothetical protein
MQKTQVCMFCRYRKTRHARDPESCCAGEEVAARDKTEAADPQQGRRAPMPERLRASGARRSPR